MNLFSRLVTLSLLLTSAACQKLPRDPDSGTRVAVTPESPVEWVDVFIGTGEHGHTHPAATVPFGMVQLGPDTRIEGWDGSSGYHSSDRSLLGFSHTHLSGTGIGDFGDILFMPAVGVERLVPGTLEDPDSGFRSRFRKEREVARPGYYSIFLDDYQIFAELTATSRAGMHRYQFPDGASPQVVVDLKHRANEEVLASSFQITSDKEIVGKRVSRGWAKEQHIYFVAQFDQPFDDVKYAENDQHMESAPKAREGKNLRLLLTFDDAHTRQVQVRVGISAVSIEGARQNLQEELGHWDFDQVKAAAQSQWHRVLTKIKVEGGSARQNRIFYTALYHAYLAPQLFMDVDGRYRGLDQKIHKAEGFTNYTIFSLWDTFRAHHPLLAILEPERSRDFVHSLLASYAEQGRLPMWELAGNDTETMVGHHGISVIADLYAKGIRGFDIQKAFEAARQTAISDHHGLGAYQEFGYIPMEAERWSVSKTLEYAYNDWAVAQLAKAAGDSSQVAAFLRRSKNYKNLYDPVTKVMRPKHADGRWLDPFDPFNASWESGFVEANAWQYTWFVPHDVDGLIDLMGGEVAFSENLETLFQLEARTDETTPPDVSGLIGQYAHGNEPSHHIPYLFSYVKQPSRTQELVRDIMATMYSDREDGLVGNEDCGQMSAWYVLNAMGFYSFLPGSDQYLVGSPIFRRVTIEVSEGRHFVIEAPQASASRRYIHSATMDGQPYSKVYFRHKDITAGKTLSFQMGDQPSPTWGRDDKSLPPQ